MTQSRFRSVLRAALVSCGVLAMSALTVGSARAQGAAAPKPATTPTTVTTLPNAQMTEAFKKGVPVLETGEYKINAGRRDAAGGAELHVQDTDVFYILEGSGVFVTGGTVQEEKTISPGEIRGSGLANGKAQTVSKGDVIVIPRGVPHWFKEVSQAPLLYFVVKTVAPAAH